MVSKQARNFDPAYQQPTNHPHSVQESTLTQDRATFEPAPSFLTQMPLGTPHEGMNGQGTNTVPSHRKRDESLDIDQASHVKNEMGEQEKRMGIGEFIYRLANGEFNLAMSKVSIMSLVFGLLFLGFLFFVIGFLAAVATLSTSPTHDSQMAWQASNTSEEHGSGHGKLGHMTTSIAGHYAGKQVRQELAPLNRALGGAASIVPAPLKPFARYGAGKAHAETRGTLRQINPFAHSRRRERIPETAQQPYGAPQNVPAVVQPYPPQQGQPYGAANTYPPAPQGGYRPPAPMPQEAPPGTQGYPPGYPPAPQQPMMPQSPYPSNLPPQPMAMPSQPIMYPQQAMPPQMMQPPPYQQAMAAQGGYYQ